MSARDLGGDLDRLVFFKGVNGKWRWHFKAAGNGKKLADSGQGYRDLNDAMTAAARVTNRCPVTDRRHILGRSDIFAVVWS